MKIDVVRTIVKPPIEQVIVTFNESEFTDLQILVNDGLRFGGKGVYASAADRTRYKECTRDRMGVGRNFLDTRL